MVSCAPINAGIKIIVKLLAWSPLLQPGLHATGLPALLSVSVFRSTDQRNVPPSGCVGSGPGDRGSYPADVTASLQMGKSRWESKKAAAPTKSRGCLAG
jgi:hypothetical protein